ncbi:UDP-N-acetylmuramoyl-tripeptide--D-alanyl-D-alanine ligase [Aquimarina sp. D1M17]|uniref:UDP-N-acetylmuramoyl-tripeptide--D-alanyl-D- alanine ligase n=1 Tax=Aquimarina acroporae TaxID=2937283 RepID=UPI0020BEC91F|nr:UDP-N-acetylmuramoyl-tripeptide--D-alanyl-D-alanine ligase [Aquimarina acroporae]MCK8521593.1 UDP-N-acetylmuramoyl-tripeptide--D-alanyl-D-alanine ligase [Aquimarina acroporae]
MTIDQIHQLFLNSTGVSTDTRKIKSNTIFFALKGENFNGNSYSSQALELGASYAIIDEVEFKNSDKHILVTDVLKTLQDLATFHRQYLGIPIIGLTGSNGKTTTKELINCVLSTDYNTTATRGNLNNHIGVPLTLLSMTKDTQIGIVEMGANHVGEIALLSDIAMPDYGYITNIGKAHLEGFGGIEGVLKGKTELYKHLKKRDKLVFLNIEDKKLLDASKGMNTYSFSQRKESEANIELINVKPNVEVLYKNLSIQSNLIGSYNFTNIAAAIAIGSYFKIDKTKIKKAIESYVPTNNRSQIINRGNYTIILDAYNANPTSMEAAINNFDHLNYQYKVCFLGDMFELGDDAEVEHQKIADLISGTSVNEIFLIGNHFNLVTAHISRIQKFKSFEDLTKGLNIKDHKMAILIKGSRGMKLERILELIH